ncbi:restriction endonuclease [Methanococcus voltae]|uniref:Restriction endonuclease n=1 Tax=Methanococcus voltae (strain ATCC BAA-1334 / A3) TaxID=456320 RepID=D7DQR7_METV3|nr:restriction endonuclease [Methanococcus voltae]MCS3900854.1 restriction system protein [Methanococcus voltae]
MSNKKGYYNLDSLDGYEFEEFVAQILRHNNYEDVVVTQRSNDKGKDIIAKSKKGKKFKYPVVVECKHQKSVGRPVVQKLQGALLHELGDSQYIKGMIVTSGTFTKGAIEYTEEINNMYSETMELELIDGKELIKRCKASNIIVKNGKIQINSDLTFENISEEEQFNYALNNLKNITGIEKVQYDIKCLRTYHPYFFVPYSVDSSTSTMVGCIYRVNEKNKKIVLDGVSGAACEDIEMIYDENSKLIKIPENDLKDLKPFEFSQKEIEDKAIDLIIKKYTKIVYYTGKNNRPYNKKCYPFKKDIFLKKTSAIYSPTYHNTININQNQYSQKIITNKTSVLELNNELTCCKVCGEKAKNRYICPVCGKILCKKHTIFDYLDKSPVCQEHRIAQKLLLQNIYFSSPQSHYMFIEQWANMNIFHKIICDKYVSMLLLLLGVVIFSLII